MTTLQVKAVFDNGGKTIDRYTVVFNERQEPTKEWIYLGVSGCHATYGIAFSQWGLTDLPIKDWKRMGKRISFGDLPDLVRLHISQRISDEEYAA